MAKLMLLCSLLFVAYVFMAGLFRDEGDERSAVIDVAGIDEGRAGYFQVGERRLMVIRKPQLDAGTPDYLVAWAEDEVYGCELRLVADASRLKAVCADVIYDLDGHLVRGSIHHGDLVLPAYRWLDAHRLAVRLP